MNKLSHAASQEQAAENESGTRQRLRIVFIDFMLNPSQPAVSGLSDIVWNMARELARFGDDVHIVAPYTVDPEPFPGITVHRFPIPVIGYRNILGHSLIVLRAWREARKIPDIDLIHAPEYLSTGIISPVSRVPVALTTPGNIYERIANGNPYDRVMTQALKIAARSSARHCLFINAISKDMKHWWERTGAAPERVIVIPHGVDLQFFHPISDARAQLGLDPKVPAIVYVGRLSAEKQVDLLLRALGNLAPSHVFHLHIVGSGTQVSELKALAEHLGLGNRSSFHGQRPLKELPLWYSAAQAVVLPSRSEGLPRAMLESLSCGSLFLGTRISGVRDHIVDGENGFIVQSDDRQGLEARLARAISEPDLRDAIGASARAYAEQNFGWPLVVEQFRDSAVRLLDDQEGRRP